MVRGKGSRKDDPPAYVPVYGEPMEWKWDGEEEGKDESGAGEEAVLYHAWELSLGRYGMC